MNLPSVPTIDDASSKSWSFIDSSAVKVLLMAIRATRLQPASSYRQSYRNAQYSKLTHSLNGLDPERCFAARAEASEKAALVIRRKSLEGRSISANFGARGGVVPSKPGGGDMTFGLSHGLVMLDSSEMIEKMGSRALVTPGRAGVAVDLSSKSFGGGVGGLA